MASIRRKLKPSENINDSRNTRMDIFGAAKFANYRADELAHMSRYGKIAELIQDEAKRLGRPLDCFEAGCGQIWTLRFLYKAEQCTKNEQVRYYRGYDIDPAVLDEFWYAEGGDIHDSAWFQIFNGGVTIRDLTVDPSFDPSPAPDGLFDMFWTTEVIEHMQPEFVEPWIAAAAARLRTGGLAYVSTPNSDGSNKKLPKDHIFEWSFEELKALLSRHFDICSVTGVFMQLTRLGPALRNERRIPQEVIDVVNRRFHPNWAKQVFAAFYPEIAQNCAWVLRKK